MCLLPCSISDKEYSYPYLAGGILVCSVPPSGNRQASSTLFTFCPHCHIVYQLMPLVYIFSGLVWRYLFTKPMAAFKVIKKNPLFANSNTGNARNRFASILQVTRSLAAKAFQTSLPLCRETFFSAVMEDDVVLRLVSLI